MMGAHSISQKKTDGALAFGLFMFAASLYSFAYALELAAQTLAGKEFWLGVEYLAIPQIPTLGLVFAIKYAGKKKWLTRRFFVPAEGFSVLTTLVEWTNGFHHWYYATVGLSRMGGLDVIITTPGFWYWLVMGYINLSALTVNILLLHASRRGQRVYRKQALIFSIGSLAPWVTLIVYLAGLGPRGLDVTPLGFVATGIIYTWGTFRYRMLDLVPIALDNIWANMKDGMLLVDETGRLLNFNKCAKEILFEFAPPFQGMNILTDFHGLSDYLNGVTRDETTRHVLSIGRGQDTRSFQVNISPILDAKKRELGKAVMLSDITERKEMERKISESERNYRELVENALVGVYKVTLDGAILYANKAMADMLEYDSPAELISVVSSASYKNDRGKNSFLRELRETDSARKSKEIELTTKTGKMRNVLLSASLDGGVVSGMAKDITEIRTLERRFIQAQKLEGLGNIAAGIAHDFNNLLGVVLGYSELLGKSVADQERTERGLKAIFKSAQRGKTLVRQLLTFPRKTRITFIPLQINDVIRELEELMMETFPRVIEISTRLNEPLPLVSADLAQMNQAFLNMCLNARDAMENGGSLTISTGTVPGELLTVRFPDASSGEYVEIQISDTGIGMDECTTQRIFEPFFTTKGVGKGTGLGLSVAYGIIESHRGYIDVESRVGEGTTFNVYLPVMETSPERIPSADDSPAKT